MSLPKPHPSLRSRIGVGLLFAALLASPVAAVSATATDPVLEWIDVTNDAVLSSGTNPLFTSRVVALVAASVYDAVNGIERHYEPLHVAPAGSRHGSPGAAAVQAAYATLIKLYPALTVPLTSRRDASIADLSQREGAKSIAAGLAWGQTVADAIWTWRLEDGFAPPPPPYVGVLGIVGSPAAIGFWRPTPPTNTPAAGPQFATMTPWVLRRPSQFRLPPPYALNSPEYAADYNEIKVMGSYRGSARTSEQSELALFWGGNTPLYWVRTAAQVAAAHSLTTSEYAHLFGQLAITMSDSTFACWDTKFRYALWRPVTAIRSGDIDGNDSTIADPAWTPWLDFFPNGTPQHPEYPSAHATVSGAAASVLAAAFGDNNTFTLVSDVRPGTRTFSSFSAAVDEVADARVFGGIHFRTSCLRGKELGDKVAAYVASHAFRSEEEIRDKE